MIKNYAIELDDFTYRLSGHTLESENNFESVRGCEFLVSDFEKSVSRVMPVEADIKYAEAMVVRKLQEEGEFDEPVSVITHWKKKRGKTNTEIFFTALPSRIYLQYLDKINEHDELLILIPVFSILSHFVSQLAKKDPIAVVFRHDRFADLVIGKNNQFYFATRCVAFDTSDDQITSLWETVTREISMGAQENTIQINQLICLNWIDVTEDIAAVAPPDMDHFIFNETPITHEETIHNISFTNALKMFPTVEGVAPKNGKLLYYSDKLAPLIIVFFIIAVLLLSWGTLSFHSKTKEMAKSVSSLENRIYRMKNDITSPPKEVDYLTTLKFTDTIFHNQHLPSYKQIINDISMGIFPSNRPDPLTVEHLQIDYLDRFVQIKLRGIIQADFSTAYKGYQHLLVSLQKDGYVIVNNTFNTKIGSSRFDLELSRSIK